MTTTPRGLLPLLRDLTTGEAYYLGGPDLGKRPVIVSFRYHDEQAAVFTALRAEYDTEVRIGSPSRTFQDVFLSFEVDGILVEVAFDAAKVGTPVEVLRTEYVVDGVQL